jgi:hypothetical protein
MCLGNFYLLKLITLHSIGNLGEALNASTLFEGVLCLRMV